MSLTSKIVSIPSYKAVTVSYSFSAIKQDIWTEIEHLLEIYYVKSWITFTMEKRVKLRRTGKKYGNEKQITLENETSKTSF